MRVRFWFVGMQRKEVDVQGSSMNIRAGEEKWIAIQTGV